MINSVTTPNDLNSNGQVSISMSLVILKCYFLARGPGLESMGLGGSEFNG